MEPWKSKIKLPTRWQSRGLRGAWLFAVGFALILAVAGCSHSRLRDDLQVGGARVYTPWPPPFLEGPVAVLFTNLGGFSAHAGQRDLLEWFAAVAPSKPRLIITHGEDSARRTLAKLIRVSHGIRAEIPKLGDVIEV